MTAEESRRIAVVGCPGSGKTTLAGQLAADIRVPHVELDGLYYGPNWSPTPHREFRDRLVAALDDAEAASNGWVVCGNYLNASGGMHLDRADVIVWLDYPRRTVMWRVARRTVRRIVTRKELWNSSHETWSALFSPDPQVNIVLRAWRMHPEYKDVYDQAAASGRFDHATVHRFRTPSEARDQSLAGV